MVVLAISCKNIGFEKTKSGMEYKIIPGGKGKENLKKGDFVKLQYKITYNDSLVASSYEFIPGYDEVDSVGRFHDFSEILTKMKVSDSAVCFQLYDTMAAKNQFGVPPYMKKGSKQKMTIKILESFSTREQAVADYQKEIDKFKLAEMVQLEKYLAIKKINATKVNNNVFVEVQSQGTGVAADSGKLVGIKYTGYNLEGKFFDSNVDSTKQTQKHGLDPFFFVAKQDGAIPGMLDGITLFKQGGKGRMFIPSIMAYGPQGNPPAIKPNESLIFDIEVVEVKDLPKQPAGQMQPPMPPVENR
jgi:FKBP-type peptidyl-prolyl cis-trans isomerase